MQSTDMSAHEAYQTLVVDGWTAPDTISAWERWLPKLLVGWRASTDRLLTLADIQPGQSVLDIGSGSGDPALILSDVVGPAGHVTATDLSHAMLEVCAANARSRGLTNLTTHYADAQALPFGDATFDRVTSKLSVMYFVDPQKGLSETRHVRKPGGRAAFLAWGPIEQSQYVQLILGPIFSRVELAPPPPDMPHPLRFGQPGRLGPELARAGFEDVAEEVAVMPMRWPGPPDEVWQNFYDVAVPMRPVIDGLDPHVRQTAIGEILAGLRPHYDGNQRTVSCSFVIASGQR